MRQAGWYHSSMFPDHLDHANPQDEKAAPAATDDDALILWMLSLTPTKRLEAAQGFVDSVLALRNGRPAQQPSEDH